MPCPTCDANVRQAAADVGARALQIAATPTPTLLERYNVVQSTLTAALHHAWTCPACVRHNTPPPMPLFDGHA